MEERVKPLKLEIPDEFKLYIFPGEQLLDITTFPMRPAPRAPSSLRELYRLAQVKVRSKVGDFTPLASLAQETTIEQSGDNEFHKFEALFGRDSLRVAIDILPIFPRLTKATIIALAKLQGTGINQKREEEPGRIPHEVRAHDDPIAKELTEKRGWEWPYYGSVDATAEFIRTIAAYCQTPEGIDFLFESYEDKDGNTKNIADSLVEAVNWIIKRLDSNEEGLLEFKAAFPGSIENQAWKDSPDAYFHTNGQLANHQQGIASIEVQRVAYDALLDAAELYETKLDRAKEAVNLRARAQKLRQQIFEKFWTDDNGGYFILGTDRDENGEVRQLKIRTSNMGHMLHSRLLEGDDPQLIHYREAIVRQLFSPKMLNVSGIRTLATDEKRFRPGAYHNGSVWLWDTHFISKGLRRHGYNRLSEELDKRLLEVIRVTKKFPEYVRGDDATTPTINTRIVDVWDDVNRFKNRVEQPPQEVQAWSVAAVVALKYYHKQRRKAPTPEISPFEARIMQSL